MPAFLKLLLAVALAAVMGSAVYVRLAGLATHQTHIDDLLVADEIVNSTNPDYNTYQASVLNPALPGYNTVFNKFRRWAYEHSLLKPVYAVRRVTYNMLAIPRHSTYAPGQFFLTSVLLGPNLNYRQVLFWGRLPSALLGIAAVIGLLLFTQKLYGQGWLPYALLATTLLAFSWENIIYSQQMESYAIGVAGMAGVLLLLLRYNEPGHLTRANFIKVSLILALMVWCQYQLFIAGAAWFGYMAYMALHRNTLNKAFITNYLLGGALFAVLAGGVVYVFVVRHGMVAVNWNAGPHGQYLFNLNNTGGQNALVYTISFFFNNLVTVLGAMLGYLPEELPAMQAAVAIMVLAMLAGVVNVFINRQSLHLKIALYIALFSVLYTLLILAGKLTFSPTRHSLILTPVFIYFITQGLALPATLLERVNRKLPAYWLAAASLATSLIVGAGFFSYYSSVRASRTDVYNPDELLLLLQQTGAQAIVQYQFTFNASLMNQVKRKYPVISIKAVDLPASQVPRLPRGVDSFLAVSSTYDRAQDYLPLFQAALGDSGQELSIEKVELKPNKGDIEYSMKAAQITNCKYIYLVTKKPGIALNYKQQPLVHALACN